jgi:glycosyltransferase involved in cell wall biosynthesis
VAEALRPRFRFNVSQEDQHKLLVIHNGVNLARPPSGESQRHAIRERLGVPPTMMIMAAIGQIEPLKGTEVLLEALSRLPRQCAEYRLLLVGGVEPTFQAHMHAQAERLHLAGRVHWIGYQTPVQPWIDAADLIVHPSQYEAFPRVILEAMAASKPIVASRVGGVAESVLHGVTGLLVPADDRDALADAIARLLADAPMRERMGREGRRRVEACFGAERHAHLVEAEYRRLLGDPVAGIEPEESSHRSPWSHARSESLAGSSGRWRKLS